MTILGDLVHFARSVPFPGKVALRLLLKPDLGARAQRAAREAQRLDDEGRLTPAERDRLATDFKRGVLADVLELAGVPDAFGLGASQLAAQVIRRDGAVDVARLAETVQRTPRLWTLHQELERITDDPLLT